MPRQIGKRLYLHIKKNAPKLNEFKVSPVILLNILILTFLNKHLPV